jgi:hypothetical protein
MQILTIIIALKDWEEERLILLLNSTRYLGKHHPIEIVIVFSGNNPESLFRGNNIPTGNVKFVFSTPKGIYNAFNIGVQNAAGNWIMFFGGDDLVLPSMRNLLSELSLEDTLYDAIVCNVAFGDKGLFKPFKSKHGLIFKNWCQQGVLYNRNIFSSLSFDEKYPIQADHKFNIEVSKLNNKIKYNNIIVAYFNTNGISQTINDVAFRSDMPAIVSTNFGALWGYLTILRRFSGSVKRFIFNRTN